MRRGEKFDGIVADPPAFGRGGKGRKEWRIERDLPELCSLLPELLAPSPALLLLSCHDARWPARRLAEYLAPTGLGKMETGSMGLAAHGQGGRDHLMGCYVRWRPL